MKNIPFSSFGFFFSGFLISFLIIEMSAFLIIRNFCFSNPTFRFLSPHLHLFPGDVKAIRSVNCLALP